MARTIEDIEREAAEVQQRERDVLAALAVCLRELAVQCPPQGRLGLRLATTARELGPWMAGGDPATITGLDTLLYRLREELSIDEGQE